jgi:hypothetical protein
MHEASDFLTVREVAGILRCSTAHVYKLINGQVAGTRPSCDRTGAEEADPKGKPHAMDFRQRNQCYYDFIA